MTTSTAGGEVKVTGELILPPGVVLADSAVARVRLLDTSLADAPAVRVDEQVISGPRLSFALRCAAPDPRASYSVQAQVSVGGGGADGRVSRGDWVSTRSHPVITFGHPTQVDVPLTLVV